MLTFLLKGEKKILPPKKNYKVYFISLPISLLPKSILLLLLLLLLIVLPRTRGSPGSISLLWTEGRRETGWRGVSRRAPGKWCTGGQSSSQQLWAPSDWAERGLQPASTVCEAYGRSRPGCWMSFPIKELAELAPVLSWADVQGGHKGRGRWFPLLTRRWRRLPVC